MNFKEFIQEMAINSFVKVGDWESSAKKKYGFDHIDAKILNNKKATEKIHRSWSNSKNNFDFYFVRTKQAYKHVEIGQVSSEWVRNNLSLDIEPKEDSITVIFTNNTGSEKIFISAWTLAHRLGHAIRRDKTFEKHFNDEVRRDFDEILQYVYGISIDRYNSLRPDYEKQRKAIFLAVGTMKSARNNILRNSDEFVYELLAQYIISGKITFNDLPRSLIVDRKMAWGRPNYRTKNMVDETAYKEYNEMLHSNAVKYEYNLDTIFNGLEGLMFVM
jgi:hypothetical protein